MLSRCLFFSSWVSEEISIKLLSQIKECNALKLSPRYHHILFGNAMNAYISKHLIWLKDIVNIKEKVNKKTLRLCVLLEFNHKLRVHMKSLGKSECKDFKYFGCSMDLKTRFCFKCSLNLPTLLLS